MIETEKEFNDKLAQLTRLYRALHAIWLGTNAADQASIAKWVVNAGKVLEALSMVLGEVEEFSSAMELRLILDQMKTIREERKAHVERA